jgi:hypothetical protein
MVEGGGREGGRGEEGELILRDDNSTVRYRGAPASIAKLIDAPRIRCAGADTSGTGRSSVPLEIMRSTVSHVDCRNISRARALAILASAILRNPAHAALAIMHWPHEQTETGRACTEESDTYHIHGSYRFPIVLFRSDIYIYILYSDHTCTQSSETTILCTNSRSYAKARRLRWWFEKRLATRVCAFLF